MSQIVLICNLPFPLLIPVVWYGALFRQGTDVFGKGETGFENEAAFCDAEPLRTL